MIRFNWLLFFRLIFSKLMLGSYVILYVIATHPLQRAGIVFCGIVAFAFLIICLACRQRVEPALHLQMTRPWLEDYRA